MEILVHIHRLKETTAGILLVVLLILVVAVVEVLTLLVMMGHLPQGVMVALARHRL
jgi:hypothetical protein